MPQAEEPQRESLKTKLGELLARYVRFTFRTGKVFREPDDFDAVMARHHPFILAMWHGQFMMIPMTVDTDKLNCRAMVAQHGDTDVLCGTLRALGVDLVRGAGAGRRQRDRGGAKALREAVRSLETGYTFGMIAEIPPGPPRKAAPGIVTLARLSGRPILPVAIATKRYLAFDTWSRFTFNLPFSRIGMVVGGPIHVEKKANAERMEACRQAVEDELNRVTARAYELAGANPYRSLPPSLTSPPAPGLGLKAYRALTRALAPFAPLILSRREKRGKEEPARRDERLGRASLPRPTGPLVWIHAASVGETNTVLPLIRALEARYPAITVLLTTGTVTSASLAGARLGARTIHQYVPLDAPEHAKAFLDHWQPELALFAESEIWPNLVLEAAARGIVLVLVNARLSPKSYRSWHRRLRSARALFGLFTMVLAQNERMGERFTRLGARKVLPLGNIKLDAPPPPINGPELQRLRVALGERTLLLAASTHAGEDEIIAEAHRLLANDFPDLLTIIVPRHPERGRKVAEFLRQNGFEVALRSQDRAPDQESAFYIADTIGELGTLYALAPLAFVGGSLVERGGQNPVEAVKLGCGVVTGPHQLNFRDEYRTLVQRRGCRVVDSAGALRDAAHELLSQPDMLEEMCVRARDAVEELGGALERTLGELEPFLAEEEKDLERAS